MKGSTFQLNYTTEDVIYGKSHGNAHIARTQNFRWSYTISIRCSGFYYYSLEASNEKIKKNVEHKP
jgi:hypothetical protein